MTKKLGRPTLEDQAKIVRYIRAGYTVEQTARLMRRKPSSISLFYLENKPKVAELKPLTADGFEGALILALFDKGHRTPTGLGKMLSKDPNEIGIFLRKMDRRCRSERSDKGTKRKKSPAAKTQVQIDMKLDEPAKAGGEQD